MRLDEDVIPIVAGFMIVALLLFVGFVVTMSPQPPCTKIDVNGTECIKCRGKEGLSCNWK